MFGMQRDLLHPLLSVWAVVAVPVHVTVGSNGTNGDKVAVKLPLSMKEKLEREVFHRNFFTRTHHRLCVTVCRATVIVGICICSVHSGTMLRCSPGAEDVAHTLTHTRKQRGEHTVHGDDMIGKFLLHHHEASFY